MATNSRQELDNKTKKLAGGQIETGKEHAAYQESQQQLLAILAERQQNLALARAESKASSDNMQTLAQAAELGAVSSAEAEQAAMAGEVQLVNPATLAVLNKYGMGKPRILRAQSHNQQVTKQNITINNNTTVTTKNDVNVPAGIGGPLQGRPVQFRPQAKAADSTGKFRAWISSAFARQNEEGARRDREYRHREASLTKSASRMMKKLEEIGKTIGTRMDPRKIGSTWTSQLKTLLFLFGFGYIANNWVKILEWIEKIANWIKGTWEYFTDDKGGETKFTAKIRSLLGGEPGETLAQSFGRLLTDTWDLAKEYFNGLAEDRAKAVKMVKFPDINMDDMIGTIKNVGMYLADVISALVGGSDGVKDHIQHSIQEVANKGAFEQIGKDSETRSTVKVTTTNGTRLNADTGIGAIIKGDYSGLTRYSVDRNGNLTGDMYGAESTVSQASDISRLFVKANSGNGINSTEMSAGIARLYKAAQDAQDKNEMIPVQTKFLKNWFTEDELKDLQKSNDLKNRKYYVVARKKNDVDYALEGADPEGQMLKAGINQAIINNLPVIGDSRKKLTTAEGALVGAGVGTVVGAPWAGAAIGAGVGYVSNSEIYQGGKAYVEGTYNRATANDYRVEYVRNPRPGDEIIAGDDGKPLMSNFVEISPRVVQKIADKITGKEGTNIDMNDREFVTSVQQGMTESAKNSIKEDIEVREKRRKTAPTDFENNRELIKLRRIETDLMAADSRRLDYDLEGLYNQADQLAKDEEARNAAWNEKLENSRLYKAAGEWNQTFVQPVVNGINTVTNFFSGNNSSMAGYNAVAGKVADNATMKYRKQYLMKAFTEKGLNKAAAAGIIGNLESEGLQSQDPGKKYKDGSKAHPDAWAVGIAGFHQYGAFPQLESWAREHGKDWRKFETLAEFLADHKVTKKIADITKNMSPQDSIQRAAVIWGHDFERFKGYDAADNLGNIVSKGDYISVTPHKNNSFTLDGKLYGDENYTQRIQRGLNTYNAYSNDNLSNITIGYSGESTRKAKIILVGDSYAVEMSSHFVKAVEARGAEGKATWGKPEDYRKGKRDFYCFYGATPKQLVPLAGQAASDKADVVVIHAGINGCYRLASGNESEVYNELYELGSMAKSKGAEVFFVAPITYQTGKNILIEGKINTAKLLAELIKNLCKEIGFGLIDLSEKKYNGGKIDNEGIHPVGAYEQMAKDVVDLMFKGGGKKLEDLVNNGVPSPTGGNGSGQSSNSGETSFLSIFFSSVTDALKNFASGLSSSNNGIVSTIGNYMGKTVSATERLIGKTEDVEQAIKDKEVPNLLIPNITNVTGVNPLNVPGNSSYTEYSPETKSSITKQTTTSNTTTINNKSPEVVSSTTNISNNSQTLSAPIKNVEDLTDSDYVIFRNAYKDSFVDGSFDKELFNKTLKEKYGADFGLMKDFDRWHDERLTDDERAKFDGIVFNPNNNLESSNLTDSDYEMFRKAAIESSSTGDFDHIDFKLFDKLLKDKYNIKLGTNFDKWNERSVFYNRVFMSMPKKGSFNLDNLSDTDYSDLKQISEKYKNEFNLLDIKGFTNNLKTNYDVDLKEWYKTGSDDIKSKLVDEIFNTSKKKPVSPEKVEASEKYTSFYEIIPEDKNPLVHYTSNEIPIVSSIENTSMNSEFDYLSRARKNIEKDNSFTKEITNAFSGSEESNGRISAKLTAIARIIGGGVDSINNNNTQLANLIASTSRAAGQRNNTIRSASIINKQEDKGLQGI